MFITASDLAGLNTTEVQYHGAPSVEEQMMLFHTGPMNIVPENIQTVKDDGHKQQAIEATYLPTPGAQGSRCLDPNEQCQRLGDLTPEAAAAADVKKAKNKLVYAAIPVGIGAVIGIAIGSWLWPASKGRA